MPSKLRRPKIYVPVPPRTVVPTPPEKRTLPLTDARVYSVELSCSHRNTFISVNPLIGEVVYCIKCANYKEVVGI